MFRKKIDVYIILLAVITAVMSALIFYRIATSGYFYIAMSGDMFQQYIHFFNLFHDLIRSGELPFWSWNYGLGGSFWNEFGYYMLGDIFVWPSLLLPKNWFPFSFIPVTVLKLFLISLGTYLLLKKIGIKRGLALIAGIASSYALFNFEHFYTHYFFLNAAVYFPFILLGYEKFLTEKKAGLLYITLFLASISNFYFLFMITVGLYFYSVFRYFTYENSEKNFKAFVVFHLKLSGFYLLSLGTAMVFFLPSVYSFLQSSVFHRSGTPIADKIISFDEVIRRMLWKGGMNFLPFLAIPLLLINVKKRNYLYGLMGVVLFGILAVQDLHSIVAGFSSPVEFRALFLFNTLFILLSAIALNEIDFKKGKNIAAILLLAGLVYYWLEQNPFTHYGEYIKFVPIVFALSFVFVHVLKGILIKRTVFFLAALSIMVYSLLLPYSFVTDLLYRTSGGEPGPYHKGVWGVYPLMTKGEYYNYFNHQEVRGSLNKIRDDKEFYRVNISYPGALSYNSPMSYDYRGYSAYQSLLKWKLQQFEMDDLSQSGSRSFSVLYGFANNTYLTTLFNNKFNISINTSNNLYGYETIYQDETKIVEKNQYFLPIGFLYDSAIATSEFIRSDFPSHDELMLRNAVVPKSVQKDSGLSADLETSVETIGSLTEASFDQASRVKEQDNGIMVESESPIELTIPVKKHQLSELTLYADIIPFTPNEGITIHVTNNLDQQYVFEKNMKFNQYQLYQYHYTDTTNKVLFRFGKDQDTEWVKLIIQPGKFLIKDVRVSSSSYEDYKEIAKGYQQNGLRDIRYGNNYVAGTYDSQKSSILFLSVPYSSGWTVRVDGEEVKTFPVHSAFMGIQAPPGKHTVTMEFVPEGFIPGLIISIVSLIIALLLLIKGRKRERTSK